MTGKKTIFKLLTGAKTITRQEAKSLPGTAFVRDSRFDKLTDMYKPAKSTPAKIEIELLPDLDKALIQKGDVFKDIANLDAICHVVRAFADDAVYHVSGSVDPQRDIDEINAEFILHDLVFIEKRIERIDLGAKKGIADKQSKEKELLLRFQKHLEQDLPLRVIELTPEEKALIISYPFITLKEFVIVLNCSEVDENKFKDMLAKLAPHKTAVVQIPATIELEIADLESEEERKEFMAASGITEPAVAMLSRVCMESLGLISYFTVGTDEVRQWQIKRGSLAPQAGRAIHTDIEKGFIRAEVIKFDDLVSLGSEEKVKEAGKFYVMGKDYEFQDGDIANFRFNV